MLSVPEHEFGVFFSGEGDEEKDTVTLLVVFSQLFLRQPFWNHSQRFRTLEKIQAERLIGRIVQVGHWKAQDNTIYHMNLTRAGGYLSAKPDLIHVDTYTCTCARTDVSVRACVRQKFLLCFVLRVFAGNDVWNEIPMLTARREYQTELHNHCRDGLCYWQIKRSQKSKPTWKTLGKTNIFF